MKNPDSAYMGKKKKDNPDEEHEELEGFDINVNPFGELESTLDIDKINAFLNRNLDDKKLVNRNTEEEE